MGQAAQRSGKFGADMFVQKRGGADESMSDAADGRLKNFNEYEI